MLSTPCRIQFGDTADYKSALRGILSRTVSLIFPLLLALLLTGCRPPGPKALLDGQRLLDKGRVPEAIGRFQVATELLRTNATAWNYLGIALHQDGQSSNAITAYQRALTADPDLLEARLNLGTLLLEQGRASEAKQQFTAYTLRRPNAVDGLQKLASAEVQLREFTQAEQHLNRALQLDDSSPELWNSLGLVQLHRNRPRDAAQSFSIALKRKSGFAPALLNLAIISQQQLGDKPSALKLYRQYLQTRPADADPIAGIIRQLELEIAPPPPVVIQTPPPAPPTRVPAPAPAPVVVKLPPTNPPVVRTSPPPTVTVLKPATPPVKPALPPQQIVRVPPTVATLQPEPEIRVAPPVDSQPRKIAAPPAPVEVVTTRPPVTVVEIISIPAAELTKPATSPRADGRYAYRGPGRTTSGDRTAAQRFAAKGAQALESKRYLEAATAFRSAAEADPGWFPAQLNHAAAALQAGRVVESLHAGETALGLQPDSAEARYNFALALKQGNFSQDAANELERLLAANPNDARAHLALANLYAELLRQNDKARAHYQRVLEIEPRHPRASSINFWLKANPKR